MKFVSYSPAQAVQPAKKQKLAQRLSTINSLIVYVQFCVYAFRR